MEYYSLNRWLRDTYGEKLYKLALDGGFTCPNRDGTLGSGGCIFCSAGGSGDFAQSRNQSVTQQIEAGKGLVASKMKGGHYIAYFQAFTSTYGPIRRQRELFTEAIRHPDIAAVSIATRPDCLPPEVLELLAELNKVKPVWVELGLQTIHPQTAAYIRRGYDLPVFDAAVDKLKKAGVTVIVHMILGLPGETDEMMRETAAYIGRSGADGIKLQLLHVIQGTDLAADYQAGKFETLTLDHYAALVADCIAELPTEMVIHRMTGDGPRQTLIAPLWSLDKKRVLNTINRAIKEHPERSYV